MPTDLPAAKQDLGNIKLALSLQAVKDKITSLQHGSARHNSSHVLKCHVIHRVGEETKELFILSVHRSDRLSELSFVVVAAEYKTVQQLVVQFKLNPKPVIRTDQENGEFFFLATSWQYSSQRK